MGYGKSNTSEKEYFIMRDPGMLYVSKAFGTPENEQRFIYKVYDKEYEHTIEKPPEKMRILGEYIIRESPKRRVQTKLLVSQDSKLVNELCLQKFIGSNPQPLSFSFSASQFEEILNLLDRIRFLDFSSRNRFRVEDHDGSGTAITINTDDHKLLEAFKLILEDDREDFLDKLRSQELTKDDLDILSGRKQGLNEFSSALYEHKSWNEKQWQDFFCRNTWIFGYGLDYRFLQILQREARVSDTDLDGTDTVISDFLLGTNKFTVLVELKLPSTPLFENSKNRSGSWRLSSDLTHAVSQILEQKAQLQIKGNSQQFNDRGNIIDQKTWDPKTILVIGDSNQFHGSTREMQIKDRTFELYRRNSRNIDILTYSELYEKAHYIVHQRLPDDRV